VDNLQLSPIAYGDETRFHQQAVFLYDLLKERDPVANISHKTMPPFFMHVQFMHSRPYHCWNVIEVTGIREDMWAMPIGSAYLTKQDEIGLFLSQEYQGKGFGRRALNILMDAYPRDRYYANVAPGNEASKRFFEGQGFKELQRVYVLEAK
jgi:RimJ/RimL family protein N-acetyltransferase